MSTVRDCVISVCALAFGFGLSRFGPLIMDGHNINKKLGWEILLPSASPP